ncbi:ABC transporter substrate-binding protein [Microbacterium radiodurans]|uniref:Extracellular solute-binding protein n=1 Tax=Microbacterium radiodurans TaxID=661398 RepID=A0A5J5INL6_9MICO|nr:extracellular solute-binding protein [Microbacterium radiodurans]KAA9083745.1 extracellular solute-binding protein [Microbacterium radiodurans]
MKRYSWGATVAAGVVILAGCSAGTDSPAAVSTDAPTGELRYESWTPTEVTFDSVVAAFTEENPDVDIVGTLSPFEDYQTALQTQLRSGQGPDVFVVQPGAMLNQFAQYIEPVDSYAEAFDGADWRERYNAEPLERASVGDQTLGLPVGYGVAGFLWVNNTILEENGLTAPTSYDELKEVSASLRDAGIQPIAFGAKDTWQDVDYYLALAAALDSEALYAAMGGDGAWDDPELIEAFAAWKTMFDDEVVQQGAAGAATYTDTYDLFTRGEAAFFANGSWNLDMYRNSLELVEAYDIDVMPLPVPGTTDTAPITGDTAVVVVNKDSKNKSAAFQLARYMSSGEGAQILTDAALDFPVTVDGPAPQGLPEPAQQARTTIENLIAEDLAGYRQVPSPSVNTALGDALVGLISSDLTPEEAASRVQAAADEAQ